jgi:hypothetical protein
MIFLLGGHDLEMLEIKRLLEREGKTYFDVGLGWENADLSAYRDIIEQYPDGEFVGIELRDAAGIAPMSYHLVDHHNENSHRPASILQVAALLGVEPDERMRIVAANDAGYIPALKALGLLDEEISQIRREDRAAQGITEEDERKAEQSIAEHLTKIGDTLIVESSTPHFSAICDRLFPYRSLLIYTDSEWVFYGEGKANIVKGLAGELANGRLYHGGGPEGYVGAARGSFTSKEIVNFVNTIKQRYEHL